MPHRPVADNRMAAHHASMPAKGKKPKGSSRAPTHVPEEKGQGPQATSMPSRTMSGIVEPMSHSKPIHVGIPGLVNSTTMGPEVRQRLVSGIIESAMGMTHASGPVSKVAGHDATAYNAGMRHIAGSPF